MEVIILAGMPATGKSTIAKHFQNALGYPILEKDCLKEGLFDTVGFSCYAQKRQLDIASNELLLRVMEALLKAGISMIIDNNFDTIAAKKLDQILQTYRPNCVTLFLTGDPQVLYERYVDRDFNGRRHLGHAMQTHYPPLEGESTVFHMTREGFDQRFLRLGMDQLGWGGKHLRIDATYPQELDMDGLLTQVQTALKD